MNTKPLKKMKEASELRTWLDAIKAASPTGLLKAGDVVEAARDPDSPAHKHFTWDDSKAAAKYRLAEANAMIRRVYVVDNSEGTRRPAFVSLLHDRELPGGGYRSTSEVVSSKALRAQLELTAKSELRGWTERYRVLTSLVATVAKAAGIEAPKRPRAKK